MVRQERSYSNNGPDSIVLPRGVCVLKKKIYIQVALLLFLFLICFWGTLAGIVNVWLTNDDYSYGFLIPIISFYFFWEKRKDLSNIEVQQDFRALPFLIVFLLFSLYGILGSSYSAVRPSVPFILILLTCLCYGKNVARAMVLPLGFLIFMIPMPAIVDSFLGQPLKHISSVLATHLFRLMNFSVHTTGNVIDLGDIQLQVVDACSGIRFLFPLLALGVLYAYLYQKAAWKRVVSVLMTIPISVLMNGLRVGVTGLLYKTLGAGAAEGFFHDFEGWLVFMLSFAVLFLFGKTLKYFPDSFKEHELPADTREKTALIPEEEKKSQVHEGAGSLNNTAAFIVAIVLLLGASGLGLSVKALPPVQINGGIRSFPLHLGEWKGVSRGISEEIIDASGAEEAFSASYINEKGEKVDLYLGYRSSAFMENENFFHSPTACLPAGGWKVLQKDIYNFKQTYMFPDLTASRMVVEMMGTKEMVLFWFQTNKKASHRKSVNRFHLALHAIRRDNTHDLFIRLITPLTDLERKGAEEVLDEFAFQLEKGIEKFFLENQFKGSGEKQ